MTAAAPPPPYVELDARSNFSFLEGASHPGELIWQAHSLGLAGVGLADRNTLAGVVRGHRALRELRTSEDHDLAELRAHHGEPTLRYLVGARLVFDDGAALIVYPRDRAAYGRLCRILTLGKSRIGSGGEGPTADEDRIIKGECRLRFEDAQALGDGMIALAPAPERIDAAFEARLAAWRAAWPDRLYLTAAPLRRGDDRARLNRLAALAERTGAPMVATGAVLYHHADRRPLQDILTCVREKTTIDAAGYRLEANAERHLKPPREMARLFRGHEAALARTVEIADQITFSLDELRYHYPDEPIPAGWTANRRLAQLVCQGARERFPKGVPKPVMATILKELRLIRALNYPHYFLTVHDVVAWARAPERAILCQGRGSAANSVVCFFLGVTSVNPAEQDLLIERFISSERSEPPDIDVDFEHERREEVIQYIYQRYGRHRAAICATVIHYRPRSAVRDVGKALGLTDDVTAALANTVWGSFGSRIEDDHVDQTGVKREDARLALTLQLTRELIGFPRHLSQHVGGFILTQGPLVETVPVGNAAMADRTFIEWDKDDIDELKIMKVDVLALGMLTCIRKAFAMIEDQYGPKLSLERVPRERRSVYRMLQKADSLGVFQVESRAQMAMLPRLMPETFYDLVVEVAIVRPGPIQGGMVHPYLRRRDERRRLGAAFHIHYPRPDQKEGPPDELEQVLKKTLGVPLFQEQAMRIAMVAARFTGAQANGLRRAMATFRHVGTIGTYERMLVDGMVRRGYDADFANACFNQIKGFGEYGFPESHAVSFANLVYASSWLKRVYPEVFCAALLNSQPMGFYSPAQIVRDARAHGVEVRHPDVNESDWDCSLQRRGRRTRRAVRLGFSRIDGFRRDWADAIVAAREAGGAFDSLDDLRTRARLPAAALDSLAAADALGSLALTRRPGLWAAKGLPRTGRQTAPAPLFAFAGIDEGDDALGADRLPALPASEEVVGDYETIRLSLKGHPVGFLRDRLRTAGAMTCAELDRAKEGARVAVAGVVLVRQRPGTAKGVVFMTLEDETGVANVVVWPKLFDRYRPVVMGARLVLVRGRAQRAEDAPAGGVLHLVAYAIEDRTADLDYLSEGRLPAPYIPGDEATSAAPNRGDVPDPPEPRHRHPRDVRVIPKSRDFH